MGLARTNPGTHDGRMNPRSRRCAALLSVAAMALATAASAEAARPKGSYAGKLSGGSGQKLSFKVKGGKVASARTRFTLTCAGPYETVTYRLKGSVRVKRGRTFRLKRKAVVKDKSGKVFRVTLTVAGKFNRAGTRARGTVRGKGTLVEPATALPGGLSDPGETVACGTPPGKQKFRVKRR